jgi:hypothetical protein
MFRNSIELRRDMEQSAMEARDLAKKVRKLEAENKRLRKALLPMTKGTFWICARDVRAAMTALGMEIPDGLKPRALGEKSRTSGGEGRIRTDGTV